MIVVPFLRVDLGGPEYKHVPDLVSGARHVRPWFMTDREGAALQRATSPGPAAILSQKALARAVLALASVAVVALIARHLDYIPMWDGRAYAECAVEASLHDLAPFYLRCWGHASHLYLGLLAISQLFDHGNPIGLIAVNAMILALGVAGFHRLTRVVFPEDAQRVDRALLSAVFMLQPPLLASVVQPGLDLPVLTGAVWTIALLIERRWVWTAVVGTAMMFSKETGVMLYGLFLGCWVFWTMRGSRDKLRARSEELRAAWPVAIPLVVFGTYVAFYKIFRPGQPAMWTAGIDTPLVRQFLVPRVDAYLASYLALVFVLNFAWLPSAWLIIDGAVSAIGFIRRRARRSVAGADVRVLALITLLFAATVYALTRFVTFSNVRYLLPAMPLLLIASCAALVRLLPGAQPRRLALVTYAILLVVSAERTVDPVSRRLWGTFSFGSHQMLRMASITRECCGIGRDQLVYSLEFTRMHEVMDDALAGIRADSASLVVIPANTSWYSIGPVDRATHRRTLRRTETVEPIAVEHGEIMKAPVRPERFTFLALPNADIPRALTNLGLFYEWGPPRRFERSGYAVLAYDMTLRHGATPLAP
jgi:hypothetical protein